MKLVAAKCPSCGANLEVNPNQEALKCQYCGSAILVDDAIAKYKLEISGEVEIKNLPKIENYLNLAERAYNANNYDEAYKYYGKLLELVPDNTLVLFRYALCKTMLNNFIDYPLNHLTDSFNEVVEMLKEKKTYDEDIESYVKEILCVIDESLYATRKYYNSYTINGSDLIEIQKKLISIINCYESVLTNTDQNKQHIIKQLVSVLQDVLKDKTYKTGTSVYGGNVLKTYQISLSSKIELSKKLAYYTSLLPKTEVKVESPKKKKSNHSDIKTGIIIFDIFLWLLILGAIMNQWFVSALITLLIFIIITFDKITEKIFKNDLKKKKYFLIIMVILLFITIGMNI